MNPDDVIDVEFRDGRPLVDGEEPELDTGYTGELEEEDDAFDVEFDEDWMEDARETIEGTGFDVELGVEMARDALKVSNDELSKKEFHLRYHDRVVEEFGDDDRPTQCDVPSEPSEDREGCCSGGCDCGDGDDGLSVGGEAAFLRPSRRRLMKGVGGATVGVSLSGCLGAVTDPAPDAPDVERQMGMVLDLERCIGCILCVEACKEENNTPDGADWMYVFSYEDEHDPGIEDADTRFMPRPCQHCSEPSCTFVCPTQARYKRTEDGIVLTNYDTCIGCRYCEVACPYGVNYLQWEPRGEEGDEFYHAREDREGNTVAGNPPNGVMGKCTFCVHRQDEKASRGTTACEDACPVDAISFGDMHDPGSDPRRHLGEKPNASSFKLLDQQGTEPNIVYIGDEPSKDAEPVEGPFTVDDLDVVEMAQDVPEDYR